MTFARKAWRQRKTYKADLSWSKEGPASLLTAFQGCSHSLWPRLWCPWKRISFRCPAYLGRSKFCVADGVRNEDAWICFSAQQHQPYLKFIPFHSQTVIITTGSCGQLKRKTSFVCFSRYCFIFIKRVKFWETSWMLRKEHKWNQKCLTLDLNTIVQWKRSQISFHKCLYYREPLVSSHHQNKYYLVLVLHKLYFEWHYFRTCYPLDQEKSLYGDFHQEIKQKQSDFI